MKRIVLIALVLLLMFSLCSCSSAYRTDITMEEIIDAYKAAGYGVYSGVYDEKLEHGEIAYIQANHASGDYIYFSFFETEKEAKACEQAYDHPITKGLFSIIYGEPKWSRMDTYGCIVVEYWSEDLFTPFEKLLKGK